MKTFITTSVLVAGLGMSGCFGTQDDTQKEKANSHLGEKVTNHTTLCPSGTSDAGYSIAEKNVCELSGIITNELTLTADKYWRMKGEVVIGGDNSHSTTLNIQEGSVLFGKGDSDFMVINRGSKINAKGTKEKPITFTSENDVKNQKPQSGDWGGLVIAGNAPINSGVDDVFEFSRQNIRFGGTNTEDNSGVLNYVVIKYAGDEVMPQKELNGLSLGGVGRGTTIDYLEVYNGKDDGIELWGGNVNMKHILLIGNRDDSLDTDLGYRGNIQYLYAEKFAIEVAQSGNGIESNNNDDNLDATPRTHPTLVNFEFLGSARSQYGVLMRKGSSYTLANGKVAAFDRAQFAIESKESLASGIEVKSLFLEGEERLDDIFHARDGVEKSDIEKVFFRDKSSQIGKNSVVSTDMTKVNKFFEKAPFIGAYESNNDWRKGWSVGI